MDSVVSAIRNTVSISLFNKGLAGRIFAEVRKHGPKVVMKNNEPEIVLMSPEEYVKLMDELNDARLLQTAQERMAHYDESKLVPMEEIDKQLGITEDDLADFDEVEIE